MADRQYFGIPIDLKKNQIYNAIAHVLSGAPSSPAAGQYYYDSTNNCHYGYNGSAWYPWDATKATNIPNSALATNPLARANHTGTQTSATISDFDSQVRTSRLDQMAAPTAAVSMNSQRLTNVATPVAANDGVNLAYVDNAVQSAAAGIDNKPSVRVVATSNVTLSGLQTIDGISLQAGDSALLTAQSTASQNGVYVVASGSWTRRVTEDQTGEITPGAFWYVEEGTSKGKTQWRCSNTGTITLGTTAITITQFGASADYTFGTGLQTSGNTVSVKPGTGVVVDANGVAIDTTVVARKYATTIGDGSLTSYTVTHNLGTKDITVSVQNISTGDIEICGVTATSVNACTVTFSPTAPASNSYRVTVIG